MVGETNNHTLLLVGTHREDVRVSTTREDDMLGGTFRGVNCRVIHNLRCSNRGDVGACAWEGRVEDASGAIIVRACH